eukprot:jgi/Ulvmu1/2411/UM133_0012.1
MQSTDAVPDVCQQIKDCPTGQSKTKADWISWAAIVLNAVFTVTAFWWSQRKEALSKYRCLHFLAVEFDHVMHMMDSTVLQCEVVLDRLVDSTDVQSGPTSQSSADVFQPGAARATRPRHRGDVGLRSAIQIRNLRVRALCESAKRLKDEADVLCKITRSSEDRRHVQRLIECLATITYIDPSLQLEDTSYVSRLVTRDLAADLLRSGERVLAICCRRVETRSNWLRQMLGFKILMSSEQRQSFEIWEKYSGISGRACSGGRVAPVACRPGFKPGKQQKMAPIKAFEASIPKLPELKDVGMTVFTNVTGVSDMTAGMQEVHHHRWATQPAGDRKFTEGLFHVGSDV